MHTFSWKRLGGLTLGKIALVFGALVSGFVVLAEAHASE